MPKIQDTFFNILSKENNKNINSQLLSFQEKYKYIIIILADPKKDRSFYTHFTAKLNRYERIAGKKILLLTILNFKEDEISGYKYRLPFFRRSKRIIKEPAFNELIHSELAIQALCILLGINYDHTPAILVNQVSGDSWYKIQTDADILERQLFELKLNTRENLTVEKNNSLETILSNKQFIQPEILQIKNSPFLMFFGILEQSKNTNHSEFNFETFISELKISSNDKDDLRMYEAFCILLPLMNGNRYIQSLIKYAKNRNKSMTNVAEALPMLTKGNPALAQMDRLLDENGSLPELLNREWKNVETSTLNQLYASAYILKNMSAFMSETNDYRVYALPLCVSFENEINLSVVQMIREYLGIKMPEYFDKYCPELSNMPVTPSAQLVPNPRNIYFNNSTKKKWLPPGLGESRLGYKTIKETTPEFGSDWLDDELHTIFLKMWKNIQEIRNHVAHPGELGAKEKEKLDQSILELHKCGLLNAITALKEKLKNTKNQYT